VSQGAGGGRPRAAKVGKGGIIRRRCTRCRRCFPADREHFGSAGRGYLGSWCHRCRAEHDRDKAMDRKALAMLEATR
jgi:hypothetical protein